MVASCATTSTPELRVLGVQNQSPQEVVFVQVTNPASRPMRLTKLEYAFAAAKTILSQGELELSRDVLPGEAVVVEVPLDIAPQPDQQLTLQGKLTAELDQIIRTFKVSTKIALK